MEEQEQEDIAYNPFFKGLKQHFPKIYTEAEKYCHTIVIPSAAACVNLKQLSKELVG
jgi:hypothetical protein